MGAALGGQEGRIQCRRALIRSRTREEGESLWSWSVQQWRAAGFLLCELTNARPFSLRKRGRFWSRKTNFFSGGGRNASSIFSEARPKCSPEGIRKFPLSSNQGGLASSHTNEATASWQWLNFLEARAPQEAKIVHINMEEKSLTFYQAQARVGAIATLAGERVREVRRR